MKLVEVGPRDGLQNEKTILPTQVKADFIHGLLESGIRHIEVASFVSPKSIPQMSDAKELMEKIIPWKKKFNADYIVLVPNLKGLERAVQFPVDTIAIFTSASEEFNKKNINTSVEKSLEEIEKIVIECKKLGKKVRGYLSTVFDCPYEGEMSWEKNSFVLEKFKKWGIEEIAIGDTIGSATPEKVKKFLNSYKKDFSLSNTAMHFHDTRSMALTNIYVSYNEGIRQFDSSAGGLGGCPYALGATGNVATEEVIYLMNSLNEDMNVDLKKLALTGKEIFKNLQKMSTSNFHNVLLKS